MKFLLFGYKGFVGSELYSNLSSRHFHVLGVDRSSFATSLNNDDVDVVIHCANPAKRFMANNNPQDDLKNIRDKSTSILKSYTDKKLILISSISCRTERNSAYGRNRREAEKEWLKHGAMVIRLGPLYGGTRVKDTLHDLINNSHIYYSRNTLYAYANVKWSANYIVDCICNGAFNNKTIEIGARNVISLGEIAEFVNSKSTFSNKIDTQFPLNFPVGPDAYDVLDYALALKRGYK